MKNKLLKGFTLIELIIVMAILSILMVGIMQMMKPIRDTYVDSTYYEAQRNTQSGVVTYLTESLRFATKMGIYNESAGVGNVSDAIDAFVAATGYSASTDGDLNIITIDNKNEYQYNNAKAHGRILRSKTVTVSPNSCTSRLALGEAYYGKYTYSINIVPTGTTNKTDSSGNIIGKTFTGLNITVSSLVPSSLKQANKNNDNGTGDIAGYKCVKTEGEINCLNLAAPVSGASDCFKSGTSTTASGSNTYIIFTLPND